jgi:hypothetical protein
VLESGLLEVLQIIPETIDWDECNEFAISNLVKMICQEYEKHMNIDKICKEFNLSRNSVIAKLKQGSQIGWCAYNPQNAIKRARKENGKRIIETMSKPVLQMEMNGNVIAEFPSIQEAQRVLSISHIWDCIVGKRKTAGGYKWRYKYED